MVAVGVGNNIKTEELMQIANGGIDASRVLAVTNFQDLNNILSDLSAVIIETATTSLEG